MFFLGRTEFCHAALVALLATNACRGVDRAPAELKRSKLEPIIAASVERLARHSLQFRRNHDLPLPVSFQKR